MTWFKNKINKIFCSILLFCTFLSILSPILPILAQNTAQPIHVISQAQALDNKQALGSILKGCTQTSSGQSMMVTCTRDIVNLLLVVTIILIIVRVAAAQLGIIVGGGSGRDNPVVLTRKAITDGLMGIFFLGGVALILNTFNSQIVSYVSFKGTVSPETIQLCRSATETMNEELRKNLTLQIKDRVKQIRQSRENTGDLVYIAGQQCIGFLAKNNVVKLSDKKFYAQHINPTQPKILKSLVKKNEEGVKIVKSSIKVVPTSPILEDQNQDPEVIDFSQTCNEEKKPVCGGQKQAVCGSDKQWYCTYRDENSNKFCANTQCGKGGFEDMKCVSDNFQSGYSCQCFHPITCPPGYLPKDSNNGGCNDRCEKVQINQAITPSISDLADKCRDEQENDIGGTMHCTIGEIAGLSGEELTPAGSANLVSTLSVLNSESTVSPAARTLLAQVVTNILEESVVKNITKEVQKSADLISLAAQVVNNTDSKLQTWLMKNVHELAVEKINQAVLSIFEQEKREIAVTNALNDYVVQQAGQANIHWSGREKFLLNTASAILNNSFSFDEKIKGESFQLFSSIASRVAASDNFHSNNVDDGYSQMKNVIADINADILSKMGGKNLNAEEKFFVQKVTESAATLTSSVNSTSNLDGSESMDNLVVKLTDFVENAKTELNISTQAIRNGFLALANAVPLLKPAVEGKNNSANEYNFTGYDKAKQLLGKINVEKPTDDVIAYGAFNFAANTILKLQQNADPKTVEFANQALDYVSEAILKQDGSTGFGAAEGIKIIEKIFDQGSNLQNQNAGVDAIQLQKNVAQKSAETLNKIAEMANLGEEGKTSLSLASASVNAALAGARFFNNQKLVENVDLFNKTSSNILSSAFKLRTECDQALVSGQNLGKCKNALADDAFIQQAVQKGAEMLQLDYLSMDNLNTMANVVTGFLDDINSGNLQSLSASKNLFSYARNLVKKAALGDVNEGSPELKKMASKALDISLTLMTELKNCEDVLNNDKNVAPTGPCQKVENVSQDVIAMAGDMARKIPGLEKVSLENYFNFFKDLGENAAAGYSFSMEGLNTLGAIAEKNHISGDIQAFTSGLLEKAANSLDLPYTPQFLGILKLAQGVGANGQINVGDIAQNFGSILQNYTYEILAPEVGSELVNTVASLAYGSSKAGGDVTKLLELNFKPVALAQQDKTGGVDAFRMIQGIASLGTIDNKNIAIEDFSNLLNNTVDNIKDRLVGGAKDLMQDFVKSLNSIDWGGVKTNGKQDDFGSNIARMVGGATAQAISGLLQQIDMKKIADMALAKILPSREGANSSAAALLSGLGSLPVDAASGKTALSTLEAIASVDWQNIDISKSLSDLVASGLGCSKGVEDCLTNNVLFKALGNTDMFSIKIGSFEVNLLKDADKIIHSVENIIHTLNDPNMDLAKTTKVAAQYAFSFMTDLGITKHLSPEINTFIKNVIDKFDINQIFSGEFNAYFLDNYTIFVDYALEKVPLLKESLQKLNEAYQKISQWLEQTIGKIGSFVKNINNMVNKVLELMDNYGDLLDDADSKRDLRRILGVMKQICGEIQNAVAMIRSALYETHNFMKNFTFDKKPIAAAK